MLTSFAPAKVNLYLHVVGKTPDGFHLLDSLVTFCGVGDSLRLEPAEAFSFEIFGEMGEALKAEDPEKNLVVRAARALADYAGKKPNFRLTLTKNLPVASGIGGGSADAAAALRLVARHFGIDEGELLEIGATLGKDIPCCVWSKTCYFSGMGESLDRAPSLPSVGIVLVNPRQALMTASVFKNRKGSFSEAKRLEPWPTKVDEVIGALRERKNDLQESAIELLPIIDDVLRSLDNAPDCLFSRMSGSGATCFGLFETERKAAVAADLLRTSHKEWWIAPAAIKA